MELLKVLTGKGYYPTVLGTLEAISKCIKGNKERPCGILAQVGGT